MKYLDSQIADNIDLDDIITIHKLNLMDFILLEMNKSNKTT